MITITNDQSCTRFRVIPMVHDKEEEELFEQDGIIPVHEGEDVVVMSETGKKIYNVIGVSFSIGLFQSRPFSIQVVDLEEVDLGYQR